MKFEFEKRLRDACLRVSKLPWHHRKPEIIHGNSKAISANENEFDLVITSLPYGDIRNTIPYHQFSKNMLYWIGLEQLKIDQFCKNALGNKRNRIRADS